MARRNRHEYSDYLNDRRNGYGKNLYRNTYDGKIAGVCAGLADHFGIAHWVMRIIFIAALIFTNGAFFWVYVICWFALVPARRREEGDRKEDYEYDEREHCYRKKNVFRYQAPTGERIKKARDRLDEINHRVQAMEQYVTSRKFKLDEEFAKL